MSLLCEPGSFFLRPPTGRTSPLAGVSCRGTRHAVLRERRLHRAHTHERMRAYHPLSAARAPAFLESPSGCGGAGGAGRALGAELPGSSLCLWTCVYPLTLGLRRAGSDSWRPDVSARSAFLTSRCHSDPCHCGIRGPSPQPRPAADESQRLPDDSRQRPGAEPDLEARAGGTRAGGGPQQPSGAFQSSADPGVGVLGAPPPLLRAGPPAAPPPPEKGGLGPVAGR